MIRITLTAEQLNARTAKAFVGQKRGVLASGFDETYFEPAESVAYPNIPKDTGLSPAACIAMFGTSTEELEYLACMSIKNKLSPGILGLITEQRPDIGAWVVDMIQRQRSILAALLAEFDMPGFKSPARADHYAPYEAAALAALVRTRAHRLLQDLE